MSDIIITNEPRTITFRQAIATSRVDLGGTKNPYAWGNQRMAADILDDNMRIFRKLAKKMKKFNRIPLSSEQELACAIFAGVQMKLDKFVGNQYALRPAVPVTVMCYDHCIQVVEHPEGAPDNVTIIKD